jgi:hypothetical protein
MEYEILKGDGLYVDQHSVFASADERLSAEISSTHWPTLMKTRRMVFPVLEFASGTC